MCNIERPIPNETKKIGNWYAEKYNDKKEVWLTDPYGKVFIIKLSTYEYPNIPLYVVRRLKKYGFLDAWLRHQQDVSITRMRLAITLYRAFMDKTQAIPLKPEFASITPLILPEFARYVLN
jgi:hypothetical protein